MFDIDLDDYEYCQDLYLQEDFLEDEFEDDSWMYEEDWA